MTLPEIPPLSPELVAALDKRFPERCPEPEWSDREIWMRAGERRVVKFLMAELAKQTDTLLKDKHVR